MVKLIVKHLPDNIKGLIESDPMLFDEKLKEKFPVVKGWSYGHLTGELEIDIGRNVNVKGWKEALLDYGVLEKLRFGGVEFKVTKELGEEE